MKFSWDGKKRRANILQHGFDFADAEEVFAGITFTIEDDRFDYGEERFITLGLLKGAVVAIAHTERREYRSVSFPCGREQDMSKKSTLRHSQTNWERISAMRDEDDRIGRKSQRSRKNRWKRRPCALAVNLSSEGKGQRYQTFCSDAEVVAYLKLKRVEEVIRH